MQGQRNLDIAGQMTLHRLMPAHGIYDDITSGTDIWADNHRLHGLVTQMMNNPEVFDSYLTNVFTNFYQQPLEDRLKVFFHPPEQSTLHHEVARKIIRPKGGFLRDDHRITMPGNDVALVEWIMRDVFL